LNNKYSVLSQEDINEIDNVLEFANGLILKDTEVAEAKETMNSYRISYAYISARLKLTDASDEANQVVIDNYKELNPYYKNLFSTYGIDYLTSRTAKDLHILSATNPTLVREDVNLFYDCYYEVLNYHNKVTSTKAFKNQDMYRGFIKLFLIFSTVQRYLTRKMNNFFNIDVYDEKTLKNAFISAGLDYFEDMPINYQRRLLKMINTLLSNKGTNQAITQIVELFGFDNIDIYRYVLAKGYKTLPNGENDYNDPYLMFFKTPANKAVDFKNDMMLNYDTITSADPYWHSSKEETALIPFNFINSKYMSVDTTIDAMNETIGLAYFMSLLYKFQNEFKAKEGYDFGFMNRNISKNIIDIYDAIVALQALIIKSHGYQDTISKNPDTINYIYGYHDIENKISISSILDEIKELLVTHPNLTSNKGSIDNFIQSFKMKDFSDKDKYSIVDFIEAFKYNETMRKDLEQLLIETDNYYIYRKLQDIWDIEMRTKINTELYAGCDTYSDYLKKINYDLYLYIQIPSNTEGNEKNKYDFYKDRIFSLTESISNYISDLKIRQYFLNNNFVGLSTYIEKYLYTTISIFKSYTIDLLSANIVFAFDDRAFNTLKLFDDYQLTIDLDEADRVDLLDICNLLDKGMKIPEALGLNESVIITGYEVLDVPSSLQVAVGMSQDLYSSIYSSIPSNLVSSINVNIPV